MATLVPLGFLFLLFTQSRIWGIMCQEYDISMAGWGSNELHNSQNYSRLLMPQAKCSFKKEG